MKIAVVGTGYVGLVLGACLAETGNDVICVDKDVAKVRMLRRAKVPIYEPGLTELVRGTRPRAARRSLPQLPRAVKSVANRVHRGRDAARRGWLRRSAARDGRGARDRPDDGRLQAHRQQEHGAGRHRREGACGHSPGNNASVQRRQQPRISQAGRRRRRLHEARSGGDWRRRSARRRADGGPLPAVHAHRRADHGDGLRERRARRNTPRTRCSPHASRS